MNADNDSDIVEHEIELGCDSKNIALKEWNRAQFLNFNSSPQMAKEIVQIIWKIKVVVDAEENQSATGDMVKSFVLSLLFFLQFRDLPMYILSKCAYEAEWRKDHNICSSVENMIVDADGIPKILFSAEKTMFRRRKKTRLS